MNSDTPRIARSAWYTASKPLAYACCLLAVILLTLVYKVRGEGIFACPASGYGDDSYLSDCQANAYGDYDHGAFWFGLEPRAMQGATSAEVLFVGNSRMQFAFSSATTAEWFTKLGARHYLLGFSHSETAVFLAPLVAKFRPRAKVYVINVDRFFDDRVSPPTGPLLQAQAELARYREKQTWQALHRPLCGALPALCGASFAVFRARDTGTWTTRGNGPSAMREVSNGVPSNADRWTDYAALGEKFIAQLPVDRSCVVLTLVPTVATKRGEAEAIAARLGMPLVTPEIDGLRTFDGSHLDHESAQRWSAAFLDAAGPQIRKCVGAPPALKG